MMYSISNFQNWVDVNDFKNIKKFKLSLRNFAIEDSQRRRCDNIVGWRCFACILKLHYSCQTKQQTF